MGRYSALVASGVSVIVLIALVGLWGLGSAHAGLPYWIAGGFLGVLLLAGAWLLARFVRTHGDEIGEARFDTRNKDERGG